MKLLDRIDKIDWSKKIRPYTAIFSILILIIYSISLLILKAWKISFLEKIVQDTHIVSNSILVLILINVLISQELLKKKSKEKSLTLVDVYPRWNVNEVYGLVAKARKSVKIYTTWHANTNEMLDRIDEACERTNNQFHFKLFMLDPDYLVTGLRVKEVSWDKEKSNDDINDLLVKAKDKFDLVQDCLKIKSRSSGKPKNLEIELYKYQFLPKIWLLIIDDEDFIFSWYPNNRRIQKNVTFHLSNKVGEEYEKLVISSLLDYAKSIETNNEKVELA